MLLEELSAPAGFPRRPGPLTCAHMQEALRLPAFLAGGFGGRRCPCHGGGKQTGPSEERSALGRTLPGRAEGEQARERGDDEGGVPRVGGGVGGGVQPGLMTPSSSTGISEQGVTRGREHADQKAILFLPPPNQASPRRDYGNNAVFLGPSAALVGGCWRSLIDSSGRNLGDTADCVLEDRHGRLRCQR